MKTKWKVIIAVILAVVISVGSISAYKYITSPKEESIPLETTLEDAAELTTQKMIISDVFKSTKGNIPLINKNKFLVQYKTTVTAGLDVKKAKIKETDDEIRITIPHCTINEDSIKIKSSDLKIYDTNFAIMSIDKEAVIEALENVVSFDVNRESITWSEFVALDIIGNKQRRLMVYEAFNLGYGNVKTLFKRLNMVGITKEQVLGRLNDGSR